MGFLFASGKKNRIPEITGLQIQTSVNTVPIAINYGTPRVPMNIIYANGFRSYAVKSGGKGLFGGGKGSITGYRYYATFIGALGEGEYETIYALWEGQNVYTPSTLPADKSIIFFSGSDTQTPWSFIVSNYPADAFSYIDTCYLGFQDYQLDSGGTIPQINLLPKALFASTFPLYQYNAPDGEHVLFDADPAECIYDFLTNFRYGVQFPDAFIDSTTIFTSSDGFDPDIGDAALSTYCQAVGMGWSLSINNNEPAASLLDRWCKNLVVAPVWTGEKLKFIPYSNSYSGANPGYSTSLASVDKKYYQPNTTPVFEITTADIIQGNQEDDPVTITRVDPRDMKNLVRVNFRDRYNYFNDNIAEAKDELAVELYGSRPDKIGTADEFSLKEYASTSAWMQLQRNLSVRNLVEFKLGPQWCFLELMDILTLTVPSMELSQYPIQIKEINEDQDGYLQLNCEEYREGSVAATLYSTESNDPTDVFNTNIPAPAVNTPAIFEPTVEYLEAASSPSPIVTIGVSGGPSGTYDPNWGGCQVWLSTDDVTYDYFGSIVGPARTGILTSELLSYSGASPDTTNTLSVSLAESRGDLVSVSDFQAIAGLSLCAIIDADGTYEFVGYVNALLTGTNSYNLTRIYRGMFGTRACSHPSGAKFVRYDTLCKEIVLPPAFIGVKLYAKLPSFNIYGLGLQDISDAVAYSYTPQGWGTGLSGNALADALLTGVTPIDLNTFSPDSTLDLGSVAGECEPVSFTVDLEAY